MLRILTATTLFPNGAKPAHGSFVAARLSHLAATRQVEATVLAPLPWLPPLLRHAGLGDVQSVPYTETFGEIPVIHPRYAVIPKIGMPLTPHTLYAAMRQVLRKLLAAGKRFDLIDAHYFYPDGVAAVRLAKAFGLPVVVTARGTDINLIPDYPVPRRMILRSAQDADAIIAVCAALKTKLVSLGVPENKITVLRNGVDLALFHPEGRDADRKTLGLHRRTLASVGHLIERKGHHHVIAALTRLPQTDLVIVGEGPERKKLESLVQTLGLGGRVRFLGVLDQPRLACIYRACDALVLASSREGWANVLLEAMACGTAVVASAVWGTPEVVAAPQAGVLMKTLDAAGVTEGVQRLFASPPRREETRHYAENFGWDATTQGQLCLFRSVLAAKAQQNLHPAKLAECPQP